MKNIYPLSTKSARTHSLEVNTFEVAWILMSVLSPLQILVYLFSNFMMQKNTFSFSREGKEGPVQGHTGLHQQCHTHSWSPAFKDTMTFFL